MYKQVFELHASILKTLANPKRLEIINLLRDQELNVSQIQEMLGLTQANLSQHLQVLRDNQVLRSRKKGKQVFYSVAHQNIIKACDLMREILIDRYKDDPLVDELTKKMSDLVPLAKDLVCGMRVSPKTAGYVHQHQNKTYYFCAEGCLKQFEKDPKEFIK